ncbi:unnamed protein product [Tenebrio molitor]|nr:unnamed protein product [Tenebrio molitor]
MGDLAKHHIKHNHKHGTVDELREDLNNINNHSFGSHTNCKQYYCNGDETKTDYTVELKARGIFQKLAFCNDYLVSKAHQLFTDETNR